MKHHAFLQNSTNNIYKKYIPSDISEIEFLSKLENPNDVNIDMTMKERIEYIKIMHENKNNLFRFDEKFAIQANNYKNTNKSIYDFYYTNGIMNNMIVHPSQILFFQTNCEFYEKNNIIFVKHNNKISHLNEYVKNQFYDKLDFTEYIEIIDKDNILDNELCIILHIGNINIGNEILDKLIVNKINTYSNLIVSITEDIITNKNIISKIKNNFINYTIIKTQNFGNDIAPYILICEKLDAQLQNKIILKLHTKYNDDWRKEIMDLFLDLNLQKIINIIKNNKQINSIGNCNYLINYKNDKHNKIIIKKLLRNITDTDNFFAGTVFLLKYNENNNFMQKIKSIKKSILFLPYYYDNALFWSRSPVHCAERIFGYIAKDNFKYNLGVCKYNFITKCCIYASHIKDESMLEILKCNINLILNNVDKIYFVYSSDIGFCNIMDSNKDKIEYIKVNNVGLDLAKYYFGLKHIQKKYDWYILINDSITFLREIKDLFLILNYCDCYDFVGLIDSNEIKYHYQSFYWCVQNNIKLQIFNDFCNINSKNSKNDLIKKYEVEFSNNIIQNYETLSLFKFGYFGEDIENKYLGTNPNFLIKFKDYVLNSGYPIIKLKLATCQGIFSCISCLNNINVFFDWKIYLQYNKDLSKNFGEKECLEHYYEHGQFENRIYSVDLLNEQKKYILNLMCIFKMDDIKKYIEKYINI